MVYLMIVGSSVAWINQFSSSLTWDFFDFFFWISPLRDDGRDFLLEEPLGDGEDSLTEEVYLLKILDKKPPCLSLLVFSRIGCCYDIWVIVDLFGDRSSG